MFTRPGQLVIKMSRIMSLCVEKSTIYSAPVLHHVYNRFIGGDRIVVTDYRIVLLFHEWQVEIVSNPNDRALVCTVNT